MMMAYDSGLPPAALSAETVAALRAALQKYLEEPEANGQALQSALGRMAQEAHQKSIAPEQLLVALKDVWYSLPAVQTLVEPEGQVRLLQRVVTLCINEYYRT